jgi:hypothetical protein
MSKAIQLGEEIEDFLLLKGKTSTDHIFTEEPKFLSKKLMDTKNYS